MLRHDDESRKDREERIDSLKSLLRGEISAVETYRQVLDKVSDSPEVGATELRLIEGEHQAAVNLLRSHVVGEGVVPVDSSGAWGAWAKTVTGTSKAFGVKAAIKTLKEGEEHGLEVYENALEDKELDLGVKMEIRNTLIPRQRVHIQTLDRLLASHRS
jgi:Domain of unknown function (DUF2383)